MKKLIGISIILFLLTQVTGCIIETYQYEPIDSTIRIYPPPPVHAYRIPVYGRSYYYDYNYSRPIIVRKPQRRYINARNRTVRSHPIQKRNVSGNHPIRNQASREHYKSKEMDSKRHTPKTSTSRANGNRLQNRSRIRRKKRQHSTPVR